MQLGNEEHGLLDNHLLRLRPYFHLSLLSSVSSVEKKSFKASVSDRTAFFSVSARYILRLRVVYREIRSLLSIRIERLGRLIRLR